tara:strand:+ start:17304 stop:17867 length:564 start_codon:yes stop_codon:yes gene_type:complete
MLQTIPESRAAEAAQISDAVDAFLAQGGQIERVPILVGQTYDTWRAYAPPEDMPPPATKPKARKEQAVRGYSVRQAHAVKSAKAKAERDAQAPLIKRLAASGMTTMAIAEQTGISPPTIRRIAADKSHGIRLNTIYGKPRTISDDAVRGIRADLAAGMTRAAVAKKYGRSVSMIRDIKSGVSHGAVI